MYKVLVSVFGAGFSPWAPGTCGSAVVAALFCLTAMGAGASAALGIMIAMALMGALVTLICGPRAIREYGPDPSVIVSDELCGQAITFLYLWPAASNTSWFGLTLAGFFLFRFFDILKPAPVRQLENVPGAWGVLLDDVMAGIYSLVALLIVSLFFFRNVNGS